MSEPRQIWIWSAVVLGYALSRAAELRLHRRNYERLVAAGAQEQAPTLMRAYYALPMLVIPTAFAEHLYTGAEVGRDLMLSALALIMAGQFLRVWVIRSLGSQWTMRCLALPGLRPRRLGPYKLIDNPEYLSRICDGLGLCLLVGARATLVVYLLLLLVLNRKLAQIERDQLTLAEAESRSNRQLGRVESRHL